MRGKVEGTVRKDGALTTLVCVDGEAIWIAGVDAPEPGEKVTVGDRLLTWNYGEAKIIARGGGSKDDEAAAEGLNQSPSGLVDERRGNERRRFGAGRGPE